jgi:hypothetical protein
MAETVVKWVHSHGRDNKNPDYDLGGPPSMFEIAVKPMNNLFDDLTPEDTAPIIGHTDYRCFYIMNKRQDGTLRNVTVTLNTDDACAEIQFGAKAQNDQQKICFIGHPDENGYVILKTEWGPPFTCIVPYFSGTPFVDWSEFANVIQSRIREQHDFCTTVTVTLQNTLPDPPDGAEYLVTFNGDLGNKKIDLIQLIQNTLVSQRGPEYRVLEAVPGDTYNGTGDSQILVTQIIDSGVPSAGGLWYFNPGKQKFEHTTYNLYNVDTFFLDNPLPDLGPQGRLGTNDEIWVDLPELKGCVVKIARKQEGWPVGQIAQIIEKETNVPTDWQNAGTTLNVGVVRPNEGFFLWVRRYVTSGHSGCTASFSITLTAEVVSWPYT